MTGSAPVVDRNGAKRVFLVDDHPLLRCGLALVIEREPDLSICGEADDESGAMRSISEQQPDLVVVDLSLREGSGIDLIKRIRNLKRDLPVLVLSMHDEAFHVERALRAGARGYLCKQEASTSVVTAIRSLLSGEIYVSERMSPRLVKRLLMAPLDDKAEPVESLSDRELQVFRMIAEGAAISEIAESLHLSVKTIETYREHLKTKLDVSSARELSRYAMRWSLKREQI